MDQSLAAAVAPRRFNLLLIEVFATAALLLAARLFALPAPTDGGSR